MSAFPQVNILHVSDIHFGSNHLSRPGDPSGAQAGIPTLKELLRRDLQHADWEKFVWVGKTQREPTPLIVAATGDLTQGANPAEFDQANDFLSGLVQTPLLDSDVDIRNLFVVPGNHDVVFDQQKPEHRFAPYCHFYNKLFKSIQPELRAYARPEEARSLSQIHSFPEARFLVAEINSCFYVEKETLDQSRGQVDFETIASLRKQLADAQRDGSQWIKIALVHHHPVLLPSFIEPGRGVDAILNARSLLRLLREYGFQLILHGHKHYPQVFSYDPDSAWAPAEASIPQLVVAGGSCGSTSLPDGMQKCNTYNLLTVKWNPKALQARVQIVTRGLVRMDGAGELDPDQWHWKTIRVFDKALSPYENLPLSKSFDRLPFPSDGDALETERDLQYKKLRYNMPVVEVLPSLMPGQGYEARVWIAPHRYHAESPKQVLWSAGPKFERKVCGAESAPDFCGAFHYWGPMLIQAELTFDDGQTATAYVYARLPDATTRR